MPRLLLAGLLFLAILFQSILLPEVTTLQVRPNIVLILILLWTAARGPREGALWAFGVGIAMDLIVLAPLGAHALALLGVVVVGWVGRAPRFRLQLVPPMLAALAATLIHDALLLLAQGITTGLPLILLNFSLLAGLLNLVVTPLVMLPASLLQQWLQEQEATFGRPQARPETSRLSRR